LHWQSSPNMLQSSLSFNRPDTIPKTSYPCHPFVCLEKLSNVCHPYITQTSVDSRHTHTQDNRCFSCKRTRACLTFLFCALELVKSRLQCVSTALVSPMKLLVTMLLSYQIPASSCSETIFTKLLFLEVVCFAVENLTLTVMKCSFILWFSFNQIHITAAAALPVHVLHLPLQLRIAIARNFLIQQLGVATGRVSAGFIPLPWPCWHIATGHRCVACPCLHILQ